MHDHLFQFLLRDEIPRPEGFENGGAYIDADLLEFQLPLAQVAAEHREREICHKTDPAEIKQVVQSFADFVDLCTRKQRGTGKPCLIVGSY